MTKVIKNKKGERLYTLEEFLDQVEHMRYHQPIFKGIKRVLMARGNWKGRTPGGAFKPGNPYRIKPQKQT